MHTGFKNLESDIVAHKHALKTQVNINKKLLSVLTHFAVQNKMKRSVRAVKVWRERRIALLVGLQDSEMENEFLIAVITHFDQTVQNRRASSLNSA